MRHFVNTLLKALAVSLLLWLLHCSMQRQAFRLRPEQLRKWRKVIGWSQEQMVEKISKYLPDDCDGLDLKTYQRWERGEQQPHVKNYMVIQKMFQSHDWCLTMWEVFKIICDFGYEIGDEAYYPDHMREQILAFLETESPRDAQRDITKQTEK